MYGSKPHLTFLATLALALVAGQSRAQTLNTLATFNGTDGNAPTEGLTLSGSTLYGTTNGGGVNKQGTIFSVPASGASPTVLFSFDGTNGAYPYASLTWSGSTLYGETTAGGANNVGTVFSEPVTGGTPTTLATFSDMPANPNPIGGLLLVGSTLYGTTQSGGPNNDGTVFSVPVTGGTPTILGTFNGTNGNEPYGQLTVSGSTLYGTTTAGGANGSGAVFSIPLAGGTPTAIASFNGTDGSEPFGSLIISGSKLYGETFAGGATQFFNFNNGAVGDGTVFSVPLTGGTPTVLAEFTGNNGAYPFGGLALNGSTLYGTTESGGTGGDGTVFSLPLAGGTPTDLASFNGTNGSNPLGNLVLSGSALYGVTTFGGDLSLNSGLGDGTVFALLLPEPSSVVLLAFGAAGLAVVALRRKRRQAT